MSGDICVTMEKRGWLLVDRGQDAEKYSTMHRTTPRTKNDLTQDINSAEVEKAWSIVRSK